MKRTHHASLIVLLAALAAAGCGYFTSAKQRVAEAETLIAQGEQRRALIELRNALQDEPANPKARLLLSEVVLWLGDAAGAERELKRVPAEFEPAQRADLAVRIDLAAGRAVDVLERVGTPPSADAAAWLYRGQALLATGKPAEAQAAFETALAADPQRTTAAVGVIEARAAQGEAADALARARALTSAQPASSLAHYVEGALLGRGMDLRAAGASLERALQNAPRQLDVPRQVSLLATLVEVHIANRELDKARARVDALARIVPNSPLAGLMSARVSMAANDYATAANELRRIVNSAPQFSRARFMLGVALAAQGNLDQASRELSDVVEQSPENLEARQLLAQLRLRLEDPAGAMRVLVPALQADSGDRGVNLLFEEARRQSADGGKSVAMLEAESRKFPDNRGLRVQLASAYLAENAPAKARAVLASLDGSSPPDPVVDRLLLATIARTDGAAAAQRKLEQMRGDRPEDPGLAVLAAQARMAVGDPDGAERILAEMIGRAPAQAPVRLALARLQIARGRRDAAVTHLNILRQGEAYATEARLLLAQLALQRDDAKQADALIGEAVARAENPAATRNAAGSIYLDTARYDAAIVHFRAGTAADPTDATLWLNLGRAQAALDQFDAARASLKRALELRRHWLPAEGVFAFLELQQGHGDAALARAVNLVRERPDDAGARVLEAEVRAAQRQFVEAEQALNAAARLQPSAALAVKMYQVRLAAERANPMQPLDEWVERHPDDLSMRVSLAEAQMRAGAKARAVQQYEQIVARQPRDVVALNNLAWLCFELGDRRALEFARRAQALAPNAPAVTDTLGWILVQSDQVAEGLKLLETAAAQVPNDGDMQYHYAAALAKAGRPGDAATRLRSLLEGGRPFASRAQAELLLAGLNKGTSSAR
jgi:predicted Zn-dependent protease